MHDFRCQQVDDANYANEMDRCMLYIACTRAMHELHVTFDGSPSRFVESAQEPASRGHQIRAAAG